MADTCPGHAEGWHSASHQWSTTLRDDVVVGKHRLRSSVKSVFTTLSDATNFIHDCFNVLQLRYLSCEMDREMREEELAV